MTKKRMTTKKKEDDEEDFDASVEDVKEAIKAFKNQYGAEETSNLLDEFNTTSHVKTLRKLSQSDLNNLYDTILEHVNS